VPSVSVVASTTPPARRDRAEQREVLALVEVGSVNWTS
jgi:hypothetical protein